MMLANSRYLGPACLPLIRWLLAGLAVVSGSGLRSVTAQPPTSSPPSATEVQQATVAILGPPPAAAGAQLGRLLYAEHCAGCHGEQGDGLAVAARYLLPRPRDLRAGKFRLVSTQNYVPSRQDLHDVLLRGMPGSSMPPWEHLSVAERDALIDEIYRLRAAGARDFYLTTLREIEGLSDEELAEEEVQEEIADYVARSTTAGASSEVPTIAAGTAAAIERGRQAYMASGCAQCHGSDGKGDSAMVMLDAEQMPSTARDFTRGIFKGGHDPQSLYRRIVYGMPGTPMPSSSQLAAAEVADIVHFIRSLSSEAQRQSVVLNRETIRARRVASELPQSGDSPAWARAESVQLRVMPLWWTGAAQPELSVQALHDGTSLAVRVSWADDSQDQRAVRSEGFEDALAMQLCAGPDEPFLGMGSHQAAVDIWYWDADRQLRSSGYAEPYPQAVVDRYPLSEGAVTAVDIERPGGQLASQAELSLPARASGNPLLSHGRQSGGSSLSAEGPGSITFRPPLSRLVVADGRWSDGRWSVVLRRSLATASAADGVSLVPGGRVSAAFAVWNGARQERANHKSITLWQDLELE